MRIVGFRFSDEDRAFEALDALRSRYSLEGDDADVGRLGSTEYGCEPPREAILAARLDPRAVTEAERVVAELGGEVLLVRDEPPSYEPATRADATRVA